MPFLGQTYHKNNLSSSSSSSSPSPTWNDWTNLLFQLIPYHMQKTNFITQLILDINLNQCLSFWACRGMFDHIQLKQKNNICCFHKPLAISRNSYLNLFMSYSSLKNLAFWLVLRFLSHNWRVRVSPNILFLEKVKIALTLSYWSKKGYIYIYIYNIYIYI